MKPHEKLRRLMAASDIDQEYLCRKLMRGSNYISKRMMGRASWTLEECYQILDMLHVPDNQLHEMFPRQNAGQAPSESQQEDEPEQGNVVPSADDAFLLTASALREIASSINTLADAVTAMQVRL